MIIHRGAKVLHVTPGSHLREGVFVIVSVTVKRIAVSCCIGPTDHVRSFEKRRWCEHFITHFGPQSVGMRVVACLLTALTVNNIDVQLDSLYDGLNELDFDILILALVLLGVLLLVQLHQSIRSAVSDLSDFVKTSYRTSFLALLEQTRVSVVLFILLVR